MAENGEKFVGITSFGELIFHLFNEKLTFLLINIYIYWYVSNGIQLIRENVDFEFMMMSTKEQNKIQKHHMAGLREARNSRIDEQSDEPQHLDQSKGVCNSAKK